MSGAALGAAAGVRPPRIVPQRLDLPAAVMEWVQGVAERAYAAPRSGNELLETDAVQVCAIKGPVPRHTDNHPGTSGMTVVGQVLRSDGHVLHTEAMGGEGHELRAGDVYFIDPGDPHWTTVPPDRPEAELIFTVYIMFEDARTPAKLAHDFRWELIKASIETGAANGG